MGISGLLSLLKGIQKPAHLRDFAGQTLGVDAYVWLHRGTFSCAADLAQGRPTRAYVNFAMNRVRMLLHFGIVPYIVFDGDYLPSKAHTEKDRAQGRAQSRRQGLALLQAGKTQQATKEFQRSIDVTPLMAREFIEELKAADISYVVAPYEADCQLAYLEKQGLISGIISEDSDLLVFGASRLITKLDQYGACVLIRRQDFTLCREVSFVNWSDREFRMMAILSGCDYLPGIEQLGLKTSHGLIRKYKTIDRIIRQLQFDGSKKVPAGFLDEFHQADRTFLHQWVYCPNARCLVNLNDLPRDLSLDDMPYIGKHVDPVIARGVSSGDLDPNTKLPIVLPRPPQRPNMASKAAPSTPDLKSKKPINDYFKPIRTPLAELDPNAFTPSPSQQRVLLSQQNRSWSASQIETSRPYTDLRRASLQAGTPSLTRQSPLLTRALQSSSTSTKKLSPKRRRLCAEVLADFQGQEPAGDDSIASHYFLEMHTNPTKQRLKPSKDEFELLSDDSIAEALHTSTTLLEESISLSQQENGTASPKKRKRLEVYQDAVKAQQPLTSVSQDTRSTSSRSVSFIYSQNAVEVQQPSTLLSQSTITPSQAASFIHSQDAIVKLQQPSSSVSQSTITPSQSASFVHSQDGVAEVQHPSTSVLQSTLTPYQPASATHSRSASTVDTAFDEDDAQVLQSSPQQHHSNRRKLSVEIEARRFAEDANDSNVAKSLSYASRGLNTAQGSEDILIPQSPSSNEDDGRLRPKLNLAQFVFSA